MTVSSLVLASVAGALVLVAPLARRAPRARGRGNASPPSGGLFARPATRTWAARATRLRDELPGVLRPLWQFLVLDALGPAESGLRARLVHAGKDTPDAVIRVRLGQLCFVLLLGAIAAFGAWGAGLSAGSGAVVVALLGGTGAVVPLLALSWDARKRRDQLRRELIPFLHMLSALAAAGLSLEDGLRLVAQGRGALAGELQLAFALRDDVGVDLDRALGRMAGRCATEDVKTALQRIVTARRKSTQGAAVADSLLQLAEATRVSLRSERRVRKGKAQLTSTVLVVLLGLPTLLVAAGFPILVFFLAGAR